MSGAPTHHASSESSGPTSNVGSSTTSGKRFATTNLNAKLKNLTPKEKEPRTGYSSGGRLTVLSSKFPGSKSGGMKASVAAPLPVNTPSLRKLNNGQDINVSLTAGASWGEKPDGDSPSAAAGTGVSRDEDTDSPSATPAGSKPAPWAKIATSSMKEEPAVKSPIVTAAVAPTAAAAAPISYAFMGSSGGWGDEDLDTEYNGTSSYYAGASYTSSTYSSAPDVRASESGAYTRPTSSSFERDRSASGSGSGGFGGSERPRTSSGSFSDRSSSVASKAAPITNSYRGSYSGAAGSSGSSGYSVSTAAHSATATAVKTAAVSASGTPPARFVDYRRTSGLTGGVDVSAGIARSGTPGASAGSSGGRKILMQRNGGGEPAAVIVVAPAVVVDEAAEKEETLRRAQQRMEERKLEDERLEAERKAKAHAKLMALNSGKDTASNRTGSVSSGVTHGTIGPRVEAAPRKLFNAKSGEYEVVVVGAADAGGSESRKSSSSSVTELITKHPAHNKVPSKADAVDNWRSVAVEVEKPALIGDSHVKNIDSGKAKRKPTRKEMPKPRRERKENVRPVSVMPAADKSEVAPSGAVVASGAPEALAVAAASKSAPLAKVEAMKAKRQKRLDKEAKKRAERSLAAIAIANARAAAAAAALATESTAAAETKGETVIVAERGMTGVVFKGVRPSSNPVISARRSKRGLSSKITKPSIAAVIIPKVPATPKRLIFVPSPVPTQTAWAKPLPEVAKSAASVPLIVSAARSGVEVPEPSKRVVESTSILTETDSILVAERTSTEVKPNLVAAIRAKKSRGGDGNPANLRKPRAEKPRKPPSGRHAGEAIVDRPLMEKAEVAPPLPAPTFAAPSSVVSAGASSASSSWQITPSAAKDTRKNAVYVGSKHRTASGAAPDALSGPPMWAMSASMFGESSILATESDDHAGVEKMVTDIVKFGMADDDGVAPPVSLVSSAAAPVGEGVSSEHPVRHRERGARRSREGRGASKREGATSGAAAKKLLGQQGVTASQRPKDGSPRHERAPHAASAPASELATSPASLVVVSGDAARGSHASRRSGGRGQGPGRRGGRGGAAATPTAPLSEATSSSGEPLVRPAPGVTGDSEARPSTGDRGRGRGGRGGRGRPRGRGNRGRGRGGASAPSARPAST